MLAEVVETALQIKPVLVLPEVVNTVGATVAVAVVVVEGARERVGVVTKLHTDEGKGIGKVTVTRSPPLAKLTTLSPH